MITKTISKIIVLGIALGVAGACVPKNARDGRVPAPYTAPAIDQKIGTSDRSDRIRVYTEGRAKDPNKIRVCLHNTASGKNKGLHWKLTSKPRYIVRKKGGVVCGEHPAGNRNVTWYVYKRTGIAGAGGWRAVGEYTINVRGREGQQVTFAWYRD